MFSIQSPLFPFWPYLDHFTWMHAYVARGRARGFEHISNTCADMHDDPFRSFAGRVRDTGGFAKASEK